MKEKLEEILKEGLAEIERANDLKSLDEVRVKFLGKQGALTSILRNMKEVPQEERKEVGSLANGVREKYLVRLPLPPGAENGRVR